MAAKTDITPEEKLLRVIQKGGVGGSEDAPTEPAAEVATANGADVARTVAPPMTGEPAGRVLCLTCRLLALATLLLIAGGAYELVQAIPESEPAPPTPDRAFLEMTTAVRLPGVEDTIGLYASRRIFGRPPTVPLVPGHATTTSQSWQAEVRDHYRLMGISIVQQTAPDGTRRPVREAIVLDARTGNMHFVLSGTSIAIKQDHVTVRDVTPDAVVLESGEIRMTLHKQGAME